MVKIAQQTDPARIEDLKSKINDRYYMTAAIHRIAATLTEELMTTKGDEYECTTKKS